MPLGLVGHFKFIDPLGRPTVTAVGIIVFAHVRPSVPNFQNLIKQKQSQNNVRYCETVGLAEWIIDDTCLVVHIFISFILA